ncbi:MAG: hypothetical protein Q8K94_02670, partial [Moraxellaceae bacterium]|nr:hypothetical protein [Moraxellaceae bacterium]
MPVSASLGPVQGQLLSAQTWHSKMVQITGLIHAYYFEYTGRFLAFSNVDFHQTSMRYIGKMARDQ